MHAGSTLDRLVRALERLHADRALRIEQDVAEDHVVRCAPEDVEEMLGNLLDNACTWARARVRISSALVQHSVVLDIDDDGPGLHPDMAARVLGRGERADERVRGQAWGWLSSGTSLKRTAVRSGSNVPRSADFARG